MSELLQYAVEQAKALNGTFYKISEIRDGKIETVTLNPTNACQNSYSVAKAFTTTAIGMLWDDGLISTDERIVDIFADELPEGMDPAWQEMTVHHLLTHTCGFPVGYLDIDAIDSTTFGADYLAYLFKTKLDFIPGQGNAYSDAAFYLLSRVVSKKTGEKLDDYLWPRLFYPLGFREVAWSACPYGYPMGATGLYIYTEDMAKLGDLYLHGGEYKGQRILSEAWVETVKSRGYEFHNLKSGKAYGKGGAFGQMLMFMPEKNASLAWHSFDGGDLLGKILKVL
ncbi:MAG: beta-lactamase family protein [Clostridia bacterium]|nr:beta-lactamase family protein [Clostridia bacterium]